MHRGGWSLTHSACTPPARANQKTQICVPPLRSGPLAALRFGITWKEKRKKKKEEEE